MAWAANEVSSNDVQSMQSNEEGKAEFTLEDFKSKTEELNLPEQTAELIFSRKNLDENGSKPFTSSVLEQDAFDDAVGDAKEFQNIKSELGVDSFNRSAAMILTGDTDGRMSLENVEGLVDEGYLEKKDGQLVTTEKGDQLLDYMTTKGDMFSSDKHVVDHVKDFEDQLENGTLNQSGLTIEDGKIAGKLSEEDQEALFANGLLEVNDKVVDKTAIGEQFFDKLVAGGEENLASQSMAEHVEDFFSSSKPAI